jgi:hypothetical protein
VPPRDPFDEFLHDTEVVAAIGNALRKYGQRDQDLEDGRQTVWKKALEWKAKVKAEDPEMVPTTLQGTKAVCIVIAHRHGASEYRRKKRDEKRIDASQTDAADQVAIPIDERFDVIDRKRLIELLDKTVPDHQRELFEDLAADVPQPTMAEERNVSHDRVRKQIEKGRSRYRKAISAKNMAILLASGAIGIWIAAGVGGGVGKGRPEPAGSQEVEEPEKKLTGKELATDLRRTAFERCEKKQWRECLVAFDDAEDIDPEGDQAEEVRAMHEKARRESGDGPRLAPVEGPSRAEAGAD